VDPPLDQGPRCQTRGPARVHLLIRHALGAPVPRFEEECEVRKPLVGIEGDHGDRGNDGKHHPSRLPCNFRWASKGSTGKRLALSTPSEAPFPATVHNGLGVSLRSDRTLGDDMSLINGDKARDNRKRRARIKMRVKGSELRKALARKIEQQQQQQQQHGK